MISRVVELIGTARPTPMPATAVLTPTIRPALSASTPPLLPGLSAASVWITSSTTRPDWVGSERPRPETTPAVTLPASPSGLPSATTSWPTRSVAASPHGTGGGVAPSARSTARSESGSRPTTVAVELGAVAEGDLDAVGAGDDVGAREQVAVGRDDRGAARAGAREVRTSTAATEGSTDSATRITAAE